MSGGPYQVIWRRVVTERRIAGFMLDLMARGESTVPLFRAMNRIDHLLATDPHNQGESRPDFERLLFEPPLLVEYEVFDDERLVVALRARYFRARRNRG
jgi:hypothetical protein